MQSSDAKLIETCKTIHVPLARFALFLIYAWFGALKVVGLSPAGPLVESLLNRTMPFFAFDSFNMWFGVFEVAIGVLFLFRKADRVAITLFILHMIMTCGLLVLLPQMTWDGFFVPSLEGQYVIKNIALIALVVTIASHMQPMKRSVK